MAYAERVQRSTARVQRLTSLGATAVVALATGFAFGRVFEGRGSTWSLVAIGLGSAVLAWALERRGLALATLVSAAALVVVLGVVVFRETTWYALPTLETLRQIGDAAAAVGEQARVQTAPTPPIDPLALAGVVAVWASVFSCHALAFRAGSPLLALVPPVALVAFADTVLEDLVKPQYGVLFLLGGLAVAFADGVRRLQAWGPVWGGRHAPTRVLAGAGRGGRRLALAALAVAAVAPIAMPGFGSSGLIDVSSINGEDRIGVDPLVSVASELTRDEVVEVLQVRTARPSYLRMLTLEEFDGITWRRAPVADPQPLVPGTPLTSSSGAETMRHDVTVVADLAFPWLPVPAEPETVDVRHPATWDPGSATLTLGERLDRDDAYSTTSIVRQPAPTELATVVISSEGDDPYLRTPADLPAEIGEIARRWVEEAEAETMYERVLAIQDELRTFTYSTTVDLRDDSSTLVRFLTETQTGFCQQFASAMAVMLRTLGIPARVAVGFTEGRPDRLDDELWHVSTDNLHAWVEVRFGGHGWLAFEPTPTRTNPLAEPYQRPDEGAFCRGRACGDVAGPGTGIDGQTPSPSVAPPRIQEELPVPGAAGDGPLAGEGARATRLAALVVGALALVLALVPLVRWVARRRRLLRARRDPRRLVLATYDVFTQRAEDLGIGRRAGETPEEFRRRVEATGRLRDGHLGRLTGIAVRAAYAPTAIGEDDALDAEADARQVVRELRRTATPMRRVAGVYRWR